MFKKFSEVVAITPKANSTPIQTNNSELPRQNATEVLNEENTYIPPDVKKLLVDINLFNLFQSTLADNGWKITFTRKPLPKNTNDNRRKA